MNAVPKNSRWTSRQRRGLLQRSPLQLWLHPFSISPTPVESLGHSTCTRPWPSNTFSVYLFSMKSQCPMDSRQRLIHSAIGGKMKVPSPVNGIYRKALSPSSAVAPIVGEVSQAVVDGAELDHLVELRRWAGHKSQSWKMELFILGKQKGLWKESQGHALAEACPFPLPSHDAGWCLKQSPHSNLA